MVDISASECLIEGKIVGDLEGFFVQSEEYPL